MKFLLNKDLDNEFLGQAIERCIEIFEPHNEDELINQIIEFQARSGSSTREIYLEYNANGDWEFIDIDRRIRELIKRKQLEKK